MSENLPARRDNDAVPQVPIRDVAVVDTDSWTTVMRPIMALAEHVYDTDFVPKGIRGNLPATTAAMLSGRELGLPPMTALATQHVVEGKPGLSAEGMRMLVLAQGHEIEFLETTGAICTMRGRRRGLTTWTSVSWTIDMARAANLTNKFNWKAYPRDLLIARCTTTLSRMIFADVIHGFRSVEELEDMEGVDEDGVGDAGPAPAQGSRKVTRKRAPSKKPAEALPPPPKKTETTKTPGPPLPGEDGYDTDGQDDTTKDQASAGGSGDGSTANQAEETGNDGEDTPADVEEPTVEAKADTVAESPAPGAVGDEGGPGSGESGPPDPEKLAEGRKASRAQQRMLFASLGEFGVAKDDDEERLLIASKIATRPIGSFNDLSAREASHVIDTLARCPDKAALWALLDELDAAEEGGNQ